MCPNDFEDGYTYTFELEYANTTKAQFVSDEIAFINNLMDVHENPEILGYECQIELDFDADVVATGSPTPSPTQPTASRGRTRRDGSSATENVVIKVTLDRTKVTLPYPLCNELPATVESSAFLGGMQKSSTNWDDPFFVRMECIDEPGLGEQDDSTATSADTATASISWVLPVVIGFAILVIIVVLRHKHLSHASEEDEYLNMKKERSDLMNHHIREPAGMPPYLPPPLYSRILLDKRKSGWKPPQAPAYRPPPRYLPKGGYTNTSTLDSAKLPSYLPPPTYDSARVISQSREPSKSERVVLPTAEKPQGTAKYANVEGSGKAEEALPSPSIIRLPSKRQPPELEARVGLRQPSFIEPSQQPEEPDSARPSSWSSVQTVEWALSNGSGIWESFSEALDERGITGDALVELQDEDLTEMGIDDPGQRALIMDKIRSLRM